MGMRFPKVFYRTLRIPFDRPQPVEPWAFIRVLNEMATLPQMLESIKPAFKKGVIATHPGNLDGTDEYAKEFCRQNPGFIYFEYPHRVIPACDLEYLNNPPYENTLAAYYNAVLDQIPMGEWLMKLDGDQLFDAELLKQAFKRIKSSIDMLIFPRLNVAIVNGEVRALDYTCPGDQWILKRTPKLTFRNFMGNEHTEQFYAYEVLIAKGLLTLRQPVLNVHFPFAKDWRPLPANAKTYPLEEVLAQIPEKERTPFVSAESVRAMSTFLCTKQKS